MYIFEPKVRKAFGIAKDEAIAGLLYLTDLEEVPPKAKRKNKHLISEILKKSPGHKVSR